MGFKLNQDIGGITVTHAEIISYTIDLRNKSVLASVAFYTEKGKQTPVTIKIVSILLTDKEVTLDNIYEELSQIPPYNKYEREEE